MKHSMLVRTVLAMTVISVATLSVGSLTKAVQPGTKSSIESIETPAAVDDLESQSAAKDPTACPAIDSQVAEAEEDEGPKCHGILTCTFRMVDHIVSLPFRMLGIAFDITI
jgi:hypothetical protein